jgi:hypothetical protein
VKVSIKTLSDACEAMAMLLAIAESSDKITDEKYNAAWDAYSLLKYVLGEAQKAEGVEVTQ